MGNSSSTSSQKQSSKPAPTPSYQLVHKLDDPNYGLIKLVRDPKTGEQIYLKEIICSSRAEFKAEASAFNKRIAVSHPNVVRILGCTAEDEPNVFSGYYKISVFIEVLQKTLADEFTVRLETGIPFSETDILLIAESLIAALSYFETQNIFHGDIRPANIFVTRTSYKLSDPYLNINKNANALSNAIVGDARTLLAPQLLPQISVQDFTIRCNKFKADVFSLGATLLSLASLSQSEDLYDYDYGFLNLPLMKQRLEKVRRGYSKFTYDMIRSMLRINEDSRPDFISLANKLLPYQEDIRRKADLPFVGARASAPDDAQETEDAIEIQRWNAPGMELKRKINALELERRSIDRQQFETTLPARESRKSTKEVYRNSIPANTSQPQENVYTCNLDDEDYHYGQENDFNVLERFADETQFQGRYSHSPIKSSREQDRYYDQDSSIQNYNLPEQTKKSPVRSYQAAEPRQQKYASPQRLPEEPMRQVEPQQYYGYQPAQPRSQVYTSALPEQQISQPPVGGQTKVSYPIQDNKSKSQVQIPIGSLPNYNPVVKTGITPTASYAAPIDDLEAKIRAALAQSQSNIRSAGITNAQLSGESYQYQISSNVKPVDTFSSYEVKKSYAAPPVEEKQVTTSYTPTYTPTYEAAPAYTTTYVSSTTPAYGSYPQEVSTSNVVIRESNVSSGGYPIGGGLGKTTTSGYYDVSTAYPQYVSSTQYDYSSVPAKTADRYEAYSVSPDVKTSYTDGTKVVNLESYQRSYHY